MTKFIVVGAGVAGLSAGIYARLKGYEVEVYERHFKAGGNLTGWDREGFHIDNCIHWLTGTNPHTSLYKMWEELGVLGNIDIYQGKSLYTFDSGGERISLYNDLNKIKEEMLRISPIDKKEILSFIKAIETVQGIDGIMGEDNDEKSSLLHKVLNIPKLLKYYNLSTGELASRFKSPLLKGFLVSIMSEHFSSLALIIVFATFTGKNGGIPAGSSIGMAKRLEERLLSLGGKLFLKQGVEKININGDKAESIVLENGEVVKGDYVVVTGDPKIIFNKLLDKKYMPDKLKKQYDNPRMMRFSTYHCAFSCELSELPFNGDIIFEVPEEYKKILKTNYLIVREFSHEPSFAQNGKNIIQTMIYCNEEVCNEFIELNNDKEIYNEKKKYLAECIKNVVVNKFSEFNKQDNIIYLYGG